MPEANASQVTIGGQPLDVTLDEPIAVTVNVPSAIYNGWVTVAAVRAALAVSTTIKSVTIENVSTNAVVYVGNATVTVANGYALRAGATVSMDVDDLAKVYVIGTAGNVITYIAVN